MNYYHDQCLNSLKITSEEIAVDSDNASITTEGGIGVKKNIIVDKEILTSNLIVKNRLKVCGDVYIENKLVVQNGVIPKDSYVDFGSESLRWNTFFGKEVNASNINSNGQTTLGYLKVVNDVELGMMSNKPDCPIIKVDTNHNNVTLHSNTFKIIDDANNNTLFTVNKHNFNFGVNKLILTDAHSGTDICLTGYVSLIEIQSPNTISITPSTTCIEEGTMKKIIIYKNNCNGGLKIGCGINRTLYREGDYLELIYNGSKWISVNSTY